MHSRCPKSETELTGFGGRRELGGCSPLSPSLPEKKRKSQSQVTYMSPRSKPSHFGGPPNLWFITETRNKHLPYLWSWLYRFSVRVTIIFVNPEVFRENSPLIRDVLSLHTPPPYCLTQPASPTLPDLCEKLGLQLPSLSFVLWCPPSKVASHQHTSSAFLFRLLIGAQPSCPASPAMPFTSEQWPHGAVSMSGKHSNWKASQLQGKCL